MQLDDYQLGPILATALCSQLSCMVPPLPCVMQVRAMQLLQLIACLTWLHSECIVANADHQSFEQSMKPPSPAVVISNVNPPDGVQIPRKGSRLSARGGGGDSAAVRCSLRALQDRCSPQASKSFRIRPCSFTWEVSIPGSAISVSAVQGTVPRSQPAVPSIMLLDLVVGQALFKGNAALFFHCSSQCCSHCCEAKRKSKHEASNHDADVSTDAAAVGSASTA